MPRQFEYRPDNNTLSLIGISLAVHKKSGIPSHPLWLINHFPIAGTKYLVDYAEKHFDTRWLTHLVGDKHIRLFRVL